MPRKSAADLIGNNTPEKPAMTRQAPINAVFRSELRIKYRPLGELVPYVRNPRTHSSQNVEMIAASIAEFGFTNPVLVDETGGVIAGHGRIMAARTLGMADVPTIALEGLSNAQKRALVIADNQIATRSGWNDDLLRIELQSLSDDGFALDIIGFDPDALAGLIAGPDFAPGSVDDQGRLDEKAKVHCPECGHDFAP